MNEDLERLERDVERRFEAMALDLDAGPPAALVSQVRQEVRHALNEAWMKAQPQPLPDAAVLTRVTAAVQGELGRVRLAALRRWLTVGAAAAAAAVMIVGLRGLGPVRERTGRIALLAGDEAAIEQFVQAADRVWGEDSLTREIRNELESLEESLTRFSITDDGYDRETGDFDSRLNVPERMLGRAGGWAVGAMG